MRASSFRCLQLPVRLEFAPTPRVYFVENPADFEGEIGTENVMTRISGETSTPSGFSFASFTA